MRYISKFNESKKSKGSIDSTESSFKQRANSIYQDFKQKMQSEVQIELDPVIKFAHTINDILLVNYPEIEYWFSQFIISHPGYAGIEDEFYFDLDLKDDKIELSSDAFDDGESPITNIIKAFSNIDSRKVTFLVEFGENKKSMIDEFLKDLKSRYTFLRFRKDDELDFISFKIQDLK